MKSERNTTEDCEILDRVIALPIMSRTMKTRDPSIHHFDPMAQDFHTVFAVGEDSKHNVTVDAAGVALVRQGTAVTIVLDGVPMTTAYTPGVAFISNSGDLLLGKSVCLNVQTLSG